MINRNEISVALLVGGASSEREVSQMSCKGVLEALKSLGYKYKLIDPALGLRQPSHEAEFFSDVNQRKANSNNYIDAVNCELMEGVDVVFNGLHGTWGEDGTIQSLLEMKGILYTGSGILASSISMNKTFTKVMFQHYGVATPKWFLIKEDVDDSLDTKKKIFEELSFPCVIKPNNQGSAVGLSICHNESEVDEAILNAQKYSREVLVEEYIDGHELTVGVLNDRAFPPLEIKPKHEFYDYTCKYTKGMSEYEVPANFSDRVLNDLKEQALFAFRSIDGESYGRVDFRLSSDYKTYCLEVNTLPGLTSTSLLPKAAKASGMSFEALIDSIVTNTLEKNKIKE